MKEIIEKLLDKQATLEADKEAEKALACEQIDASYAERAGKISAMLEMAGYVPPVVETVDEAVDEVVDEEIKAVDETVDAKPVSAEASNPEQVVY